MRGHLATPQNGTLYTNEPLMGSHLPKTATFHVSQGWLLIEGTNVVVFTLTVVKVLTNFSVNSQPILVVMKFYKHYFLAMENV